MMSSTPVAGATSPGGLFFPDSSKKNDGPKEQIANPLLSRTPGFSPSAHAMTHRQQRGQQANTTLTPLSQNNGLRQRKPVRPVEKKTPGILNLPPGLASTSLGAGVTTWTMASRSTPTAQQQQQQMAANQSSTPTTEAAVLTATALVATTARNSPSPRLSSGGSWILVYGYTNQSQYEELVRQFSSFGQVLKHQGSCQPGRSNWIAFQYESILEAEKALCHQHTEIVDGIFCGVKRLADNDPILMRATAQGASLSSLWNKEEEKGRGAATASASNKTIMGEDDILMSPNHPSLQGRRKRGVCEQFFMWIYSISDSE